MSQQIRLGFIGAGPRSVGLMRTAEGISGVRITAICDRYRALAESAAASLSVEPDYVGIDHERFLREAPIDAVFVVVPPQDAVPLSIESLAAGKHVLSEVPMSFDIDECMQLVLAVERSGGLIYQLAEQVRFQLFIQEWRRLTQEGTLGSIVHAEGQYLHGMTEDRFWLDGETGQRLTLAQAAAHPNKVQSRLWKMPHAILYLPHELSPLLHAMDDRVTSVVAMANAPPSRVYDFYPASDFEVALMKTQKGATMRLSASFTVLQPSKSVTGRHWYNIIGTKGSVETHRAKCDQMKVWLPEGDDTGDVEQVMWRFDETNTPSEAAQSGHDGGDYWPLSRFAESILQNKPSAMNVYQAAEAAAPAILAARSIEQNSRPMNVPDFRPGAHRLAGQPFPDSET